MGVFLHRFNVKPRHLDAWLELWPVELELRHRHGFRSHQAFLETHAEPKITWLYEHDDADEGSWRLRNDPDWLQLQDDAAPHVFLNLVVRPVRVELLSAVAPDPSRTVCMRRYSIVGEWAQFLGLWERIVPLREQHGFRCLFAVTDEPRHLFTWAFEFEGEWDDLPALQREYYQDPARRELNRVFDYMADYTLTPARALPLGERLV